MTCLLPTPSLWRRLDRRRADQKRLGPLSQRKHDISRILAPAGRIRTVFLLVFIVLGLGAWALYDVARLEQAQPIVAGLALLAIMVFMSSAVAYLNRVLLYSQNTPRKP